MVSENTARRIGEELNVDFRKVSLKEFRMGLSTELEHTRITAGDLILTGMIALDHLKEMPDYYSKLQEMEKGVK